MITDKKHAALTAAHLAMSMGDNDQLATEMLTTLFDDGNRDDAVFELVQQYRFTGESLYLHHCGLGIYGADTAPWLSTPDDFRLALTLYCANVPILAAFIPPEVKQQATPAPDPRRGFDSVNDDEDNRGTIYEPEKLRAAEGAIGQSTQENVQGGDRQADGGAEPVSAGSGALSPSATRTTVAADGDGEDAATVAGGHSEASEADVTENTDSAAELDTDDPFSGGDVVDDDAPSPFDDDDDDGDDDDGIVGDDPPPPPNKGKKKKA